MNELAKLKESIISGKCQPLTASPDGVELRMFVSSDCGATGFSTGTATFRAGAELPCHLHECGVNPTLAAPVLSLYNRDEASLIPLLVRHSQIAKSVGDILPFSDLLLYV